MVSKNSVFLILLFFFKFKTLVWACTKTDSLTSDSTNGKMCRYNVTLRDNTNVIESSLCGDDFNALKTLLATVNNTLMEVAIHLTPVCQSNVFELNYPLLDTYSLTLKNNEIKFIKLNISDIHLDELDLSKNVLVPKQGFLSNLKRLRKLTLKSNGIYMIPEKTFEGLTKLESLDLSDNNLTNISHIFASLKNLYYLNISRNNIDFIDETCFDNWMLQHLDVSHNNLIKLSPGAFQPLPNLAQILMADNPNLGFTQVNTQLLVGTGRRLQQIDASRTGLHHVPEAFTHSVRFLTLSGNKISSVRSGDMDSYPLLQSFDLSNNILTMVEDDSLGRLEMLLFLNLNNNLLTSLPRSLPEELKYLSVNNNSLNNLTALDFKGLTKLRILLLKNNNIHFIDEHSFGNLVALEMLDLSNNPLKSLSASILDGPLALRVLRLCYLNVSVLEQDGAFPMSSPETLQMIHLQSSPSLARQLLGDSAALAALSHLQYLDLRMNNLTGVRNDLLFYLSQLKTLRLSGNSFNCSSELWLRDWLNTNTTLENEESCFYTTINNIDRHNCTYSESFTINHNLPSLNLFSTDIINELLSSFGYYNNRTTYKNKVPKKLTTSINKKTKIINKNNMGLISKKKLQKKSQPDSSVNQSVATKNTGKEKEFKYKLNTGKKFNTPTKTHIEKKETNSSVMNYQNDLLILARNITKTKYSPYQASEKSNVPHVAVVSFIAVVMAVVLLAIFRMRITRRQPPERREELIEVSNISGRVLW